MEPCGNPKLRLSPIKSISLGSTLREHVKIKLTTKSNKVQRLPNLPDIPLQWNFSWMVDQRCLKMSWAQKPLNNTHLTNDCSLLYFSSPEYYFSAKTNFIANHFLNVIAKNSSIQWKDNILEFIKFIWYFIFYHSPSGQSTGADSNSKNFSHWKIAIAMNVATGQPNRQHWNVSSMWTYLPNALPAPS